MKVQVELECAICGEITTIHEKGLNDYEVYPCKKCYPKDWDETWDD